MNPQLKKAFIGLSLVIIGGSLLASPNTNTDNVELKAGAASVIATAGFGLILTIKTTEK